VTDRRRIAVVRQGRELVVVPVRLYMENGRDVLEARHPTTGDMISFRIDEVDRVEVVAR
jgi:hypothetical protein